MARPTRPTGGYWKDGADAPGAVPLFPGLNTREDTVLDYAEDLAALGALSDVVVDPEDGDQLYYNAADARWDGRRRHFFYMDDFYATDVEPASATAQQDLDAIRGAWAACETAREAGKAAVLRLPIRQINPQGTGTADFVLTWTPSWSSANGSITVVGGGQTASVVRLGSSQKCFMQMQFGSTSSPPTYRNLRLQDFTVDAASQNPTTSNHYGVVMNMGGRANMYNFAAERVDTINLGTLRVSGVERRSFNFTFYGGNHTAAYAEVVGFRLRDCYFGRSGGGGNYGCVVQAYVSTTQTTRDILNVDPFGGRSNFWMDKFDIQGCRWESGGPMPSSPDAYSSCGFMFGNTAMGGSLRIRDCHVADAADDGFEINSWYDVVVDGCTSTNCPQEGFYFTNLGGMPNPERQTIRISNCTTYKTDTIGSSTTLYGIGVRGRVEAPTGTVIVENCRSVGNPLTMKGAQTLVFRDYIHRIVIRDYHVATYGARTFTGSSTSAAFGAPVQIALFGCKSTVDIDGVWIDSQAEFTLGATSNQQMQSGAVGLASGADVTVSSKNCQIIRRTRTDSGDLSGFASAKRFPVIGIGARTIPNGTDGVYRVYALTGAGAIGETSELFAWSGDLDDTDGDADGKYVSANPKTELVFRTSLTVATDGINFATFKTPSSMAAGFKAMVSPKSMDTAVTGADRHATGPSRLIETYVCDDGTNSYLCIDKVEYAADGTATRTSLLGSVVGGAGTVTTIGAAAITSAGCNAAHYATKGVQLASRLTGAQTIYVYGSIRDNVVRANVASSAPSSTTYLPGTTLGDTSITLTDADSKTYGDPVTGAPALGIVALDNTSRFTAMQFVFRQVVRGVLEGLMQSSSRPGVTGGDYSAVYVYSDSNTLRIAGLHIRDTDLSRWPTAAASCTPVGGADATQLKGFRIGPNVLLGDGQRVDRPVLPAMMTGSVAGGNTGTAQTIDPSSSDYWMATYTLTGNVTFTLANVPKNGTIDLLLTQDGAGSKTVTFTPPAGGSVKYAGGALGITATAGATDLVTLTTLDGLNFYVAAVHDLK